VTGGPDANADGELAVILPDKAPVGGKPTGGEFHGGWTWQVPPIGHYNTFAANAILAGGLYQDLMEMPLAIYQWEAQNYLPVLGTDFEMVSGDTFRIRLREGVKWSDGKPFTSKDVVTTFTLLHLQNSPAWNYLGEVKADGDYAVTFKMATPSTVAPRYALREPIRSDAVYGEWARKAQALFDQGKASDSKEFTALRADFEAFRPEKMVVTGPYQIDQATLTESQLTMTKVPTAWHANRVNFDRIVVYHGETPAITPLVLGNQVDYATHGFPPATAQAFKAQGIRVLKVPTFTGDGIWFNYAKVKAVADPRVRQAIAMAIDRPTAARVAMGEYGAPDVHQTGVPDEILEKYLSKEQLSQLNQYNHDPAKATQIMEQLGFKKEGGVWVSPQGERMEYELLVPAEFANKVGVARAVAPQLTQWGLKLTVRTITFTQFDASLFNGNFQMAISTYGAGQPHPMFSFRQALLTYNKPEAPGPGMNYPLEQEVPGMGKVDLQQMIIDSAEGINQAEQGETIFKLSKAVNYLLPIIPIYHKVGNNPALEGVRVTGWPPDSDPLYKNSPYTDSFVVIWILDGTLKGVQR
jgi:peptide/nickel transport system substrate-binding protein